MGYKLNIFTGRLDLVNPPPAPPTPANSFVTIQPDTGTSPVATSPTDVLTIHGTGGISVSGNAGTDTITIDGSGISISPASPVTSIQFNDSGAFGGTSDLTWDGTHINALGYNATGAVSHFNGQGIDMNDGSGSGGGGLILDNADVTYAGTISQGAMPLTGNFWIDGSNGNSSFANGTAIFNATTNYDQIAAEFKDLNTAGVPFRVVGNTAYGFAGDFPNNQMLYGNDGSLGLGLSSGLMAWQFNADGSASFAGGAAEIDVSGNLTASSALLQGSLLGIGNNLGTYGNMYVPGSGSMLADFGSDLAYGVVSIFDAGHGTTPSIVLHGQNGGSFSYGAITLGSNTGTAAYINSDGSASFANGTTTIDVSGNVVATSFSGNGSGLTSIPSPFDQSLNTTDDVLFNAVTATATMNSPSASISSLLSTDIVYGDLGKIYVDLTNPNGDGVVNFPYGFEIAGGTVIFGASGDLNVSQFWVNLQATINNQQFHGGPGDPTLVIRDAVSGNSLTVGDDSNNGRSVVTYNNTLDDGIGNASVAGGLKLADYTSIGSPVEAQIAWNFTAHKQMVYNGSAWQTVTSI